MRKTQFAESLHRITLQTRHVHLGYLELVSDAFLGPAFFELQFRDTPQPRGQLHQRPRQQSLDLDLLE